MSIYIINNVKYLFQRRDHDVFGQNPVEAKYSYDMISRHPAQMG